MKPAREWPRVLGAGALALAPLAVFHRAFAQLFWFGDDLDQIAQIDRLGFWPWVGRLYGENCAPLFKVAWGGGLFAFGGSYFAMIGLLGLTHAFNTILLGRVMRAALLPWTAVWFAQVVFALTPVTIETLGWSVQWAPMLSSTFFLAALDLALRAEAGRRPFSSRAEGALALFSAASALSFARGVLTGPVAALACCWPAPARRAERGRCVRAAAFCLVPAVGAALVIAIFSGGNQKHMAGHWGEAAQFGLEYFCLNPLHELLAVDSLGPRTVGLLGALKGVVIVWALVASRGGQRQALALLLVCDAGNAVLLGIGRYQTGLGMAVSSRYQYASLLGFLPLAGFLFSRALAALAARCGAPRWEPAIAALALAAAGAAAAAPWPATLAPFVAYRGTELREHLLSAAPPGSYELMGLPGLPVAEARRLVARYHLH